MRRSKTNTTSGFTIVELLIVIVVIGILAAITIVAYNGVQARANASKAKSDLKQLAQAMTVAKIQAGRTLVDIDASTGTGRPCWSKPSGTDIAALPKTDACWTQYFATLDTISNLTNINVRNMVDPWGRPYFIDETEGEYADPCTYPDRVSVYSIPFATGYNSNDPAYRVDIPYLANC